MGLGTYHSWGIISISARTLARILSLKESIEGGSRSSGSRGAGAPMALTLNRPGGWQPGGGSDWVCSRFTSPLGS